MGEETEPSVMLKATYSLRRAGLTDVQITRALSELQDDGIILKIVWPTIADKENS